MDECFCSYSFEVSFSGIIVGINDGRVLGLCEDLEVYCCCVLVVSIFISGIDYMEFELGEFVDVVVYGVVDLFFSLFCLWFS